MIIDGVLEASKAMRRREFIAFVGSTAVVWPLAVRAQQSERVRRVGVLESAGIETDQQAGVAVFREVLHQLGWIDGDLYASVTPGSGISITRP